MVPVHSTSFPTALAQWHSACIQSLGAAVQEMPVRFRHAVGEQTGRAGRPNHKEQHMSIHSQATEIARDRHRFHPDISYRECREWAYRILLATGGTQ